MGDVEETSVTRAYDNALLVPRKFVAPQPTFLLGSSSTLPLCDCSVDLLIVDPPWGQRHCTATYVKKYIISWALEWIRVLKIDGVAIIVTIMSSLIEAQVLPALQASGVHLEDVLHFDNKGWTQCRMYV